MVDMSHAASWTVSTVPLCRNWMIRARHLIDLEHREWIVERELALANQIVHGTRIATLIRLAVGNVSSPHAC